MALTKRTFVDKYEILTETGNVQVREATVIEEDGVELSRTYLRYVVEPTADVSAQPEMLRNIVAQVKAEKARAK